MEINNVFMIVGLFVLFKYFYFLELYWMVDSSLIIIEY